MLADRLSEAAAETVSAIVAHGGAGWSVTLDVTDAAAWNTLVSAVLQRHGRIDCLVKNAGIDIAATIETATADAFRRIFEINVMGAFHGMQAVIPSMRQHSGGSIVNIASLGTHKIAPTSTIYSPLIPAGVDFDASDGKARGAAPHSSHLGPRWGRPPRPPFVCE